MFNKSRKQLKKPLKKILCHATRPILKQAHRQTDVTSRVALLITNI